MKIRNGFVSNSSSSSFVVRRNEWKQHPKLKKAIQVSVLTKEQDKALKKYGFRKTVAHSPDRVPCFYDVEAWKKENAWIEENGRKIGWNWGFEITCNQDEVMVFLIENKIPFVASCHYGHESVVYVPKDNKVYEGTNFGAILEMYGPDIGLEGRQSKGIKVFDAKEWAKKHDY